MHIANNIFRAFNLCMKNIINPAVKFSYSVVKGSQKNRQALVSKYNEQIFENIYTNIKDDTIHLSDIKRAINEVLPEKKRIEIKPFKSNGQLDGASDYIYGNGDSIIGQTIELPMTKCRMHQNALITFMHELTHVLDALVNPKITSRTNRMFKNKLYTHAFDNVMDKKLYKYEKFSDDAQKSKILEERRNEVKDFLRGKPAEDKIDYIQEMRNTLLTEKNAYSEQLKYAQILDSRNKPVEKTDLVDETVGYMFDEKLQMLKEIGFEVISKQRKSLAKKYSRKM